jgi:hypothetical protein
MEHVKNLATIVEFSPNYSLITYTLSFSFSCDLKIDMLRRLHTTWLNWTDVKLAKICHVVCTADSEPMLALTINCYTSKGIRSVGLDVRIHW